MFNFMPAANINQETGIHYGVISGNSLDPDLLFDLYMKAENIQMDEALIEYLCQLLSDNEIDYSDLSEVQPLIDCCEANDLDVDLDYFADCFEAYEPSGSFVHDGINVTFSWLGGAPIVFVMASPYTTKAALCSPCCPNAGDLDNLDHDGCLLYTSPSPRDRQKSRMPSSA